MTVSSQRGAFIGILAINQVVAASIVLAVLSAGIARSTHVLLLSVRHVRSVTCCTEFALHAPELRLCVAGREQSLNGEIAALRHRVSGREPAGCKLTVKDPTGNRVHSRTFAPVVLR